MQDSAEPQQGVKGGVWQEIRITAQVKVESNEPRLAKELERAEARDA